MFGIDDIIGVGMKLLDKVIPDPEAKAAAQAKLLELQQQGQLAELQAQGKEQEEISKRWSADMASDSWLSKNIRPMALIAIFMGFFIFTTMSAFGLRAEETYVQLLGQWGQIVFLAYFGGRTVEKVMEMKNNAK